MKKTQLQLRPYDAKEDEGAVLMLWGNAFGESWAVNPAAFRNRLEDAHALVAERDGAVVGFAAAHAHEDSGQLTALMVRPDFQRKGIGTALSRASLEWMGKKGARQARFGSGAGPYLWPGVPSELKPALRFFRKRGWKHAERLADLVMDVSSYRAPRWAMERANAAGVKMAPATAKDGPAILAFEKLHFEDWYRSFKEAVSEKRFDEILLARMPDGELAGTLLFPPKDRDFTWEPVLGSVGGFGCVGVAEKFREMGIGMAMCARSMELLREAGTKTIYVAWVYLIDWYGKLGLKPWREYRAAQIRLKR